MMTDPRLLSRLSTSAIIAYPAEVKSADNDGYAGVQVTFGDKRANRVNKSQAGHFAKAGVQAGAITREFRTEAQAN